MSEKKEPTFEESMARLEAITARLDQGDTPLEEALALFEEGAALMKRCTETLDKAEQKVVKLVPGLGGEIVEEPMEELE